MLFVCSISAIEEYTPCKVWLGCLIAMLSDDVDMVPLLPSTMFVVVNQGLLFLLGVGYSLL